ncbi:MAG: FAD-dependent oxidoreductase [Clostridia bacterium]|nr:FAD-dependent oxidoreductase [Clostridia bacterium]
MKDVIIIGSGPAGALCAIYLKRYGLDIELIEKSFVGGQAAVTSEIENYLGFPVIDGAEFSFNISKQLKKMETKPIKDDIVSVELLGDVKKIIGKKNEYFSKAVVIATGARRRKLGVKGEEEFFGRGVSYCATCDGNFYRNKVVAVAGGGNTALEEALFLSGICQKVYLIHRREDFRGYLWLSEKVREKENIELLLSSEITEIKGDDRVSKIVVSGKGEIDVSAVFVAIGTIPNSEIFDLEKTSNGEIITDNKMSCSEKGVFACGDVRNTVMKQIITAAADGAIAAESAMKYLMEK